MSWTRIEHGAPETHAPAELNLHSFDSRLPDPSCTAAVFSAFNCDSFDNGERYLKADYSIDCDSTTHRGYQLFAGAMFIWPLGVPLLCAKTADRTRDLHSPCRAA